MRRHKVSRELSLLKLNTRGDRVHTLIELVDVRFAIFDVVNFVDIDRKDQLVPRDEIRELEDQLTAAVNDSCLDRCAGVFREKTLNFKRMSLVDTQSTSGRVKNHIAAACSDCVEVAV